MKDLSDVKRLPIMITLIIGAFFSILNETLMNIALNNLTTALNVTHATIQWLSSGYLLVVAILIPASALMMQWFTTRQMFLGAMTLFTLGTLVCSIAPGFSVLLVGRLIQACATGLLLPVMMNTILLLFPPDKRGAAMGTMGLVIMFAPAIGPTLGGLILSAFDWRWLFIFVLPFAFLSIIIGAIYMKNVSDVTRPKVDFLSILFSTLGFGGIVFGFSSMGEEHLTWASPRVYVFVIIGMLALLLFVWRQLKAEEPMMDLRAFKSPMFSLTTVLLLIMMMTMFSTLILLPMLLQGGLLLTAAAAGLILLPGGIVNGLMSPIAGKLFDKFGPRPLVIPGSILLVVIMWLFSEVTLDTSKTTIIVLYCLLMIGIALIMMPAQTNGLNQLPRRLYPHGTAILNTLQQVAGAIGIAFFMSLMASGMTRYMQNPAEPISELTPALAMSSGVSYAFKIALIFAVIAFIITLFVKRTTAPEEAESGEPYHVPLKPEPGPQL